MKKYIEQEGGGYRLEGSSEDRLYPEWYRRSYIAKEVRAGEAVVVVRNGLVNTGQPEKG